MEDNIAVLVDAKLEYTKQLTTIIIPFIFEGIKSIYTSTISMCRINNDKSVLMRFQEQLSQIPRWNQDIIEEEYQRIINSSQCDWLDDLVTAVFLSHTKILTSIKSGKKQNKINLKIPKIDHFIHKCYIESAREFWKNPYIFSNKVSQSEYQRNISDGHRIIGNCIEETIRKLLPVKNILKEYLGPSYEDDNNSLLPENYKENLKKLVQKEMEICKKGDSVDADKIVEQLQNIESVEENDIEEINIGIPPKSKELNVQDIETKNLDIEDIEESTVRNSEKEIPNTLNNIEEEIDLDNMVSEEVKLSEELPEVIEEIKEVIEDDKLPEIKEVIEEVTLPDIKEVIEEVTLPDIKEVIEEVTLPEIKEVIEEITLPETKVLEEVVYEEPEPVPKSENINLEITPNTEFSFDNIESDLEEFNMETISLKPEEKNVEQEDLQQVKSIIDNNLYDKDLLEISDNSDSEELKDNEMTIENMKFKKLDLDSLNIESLDDNLDFDTSDIKTIDSEDIKFEKPEETTHETLTKNKDTKTIIIEEDKSTPISKFSKPKKKNFRFFD